MICNGRSYWSMLKTNTVTVRVEPRTARSRLVFRVAQVIDTGFGRPKITIECVAHTAQPGAQNQDAHIYDVDFELPDTLAHLDLLYTKARDAKRLLPHQRIDNLHESAQVEEIVPDVVRPGDLIVMERDVAKSRGSSAASARSKSRVFRVMDKAQMQMGKSKNAL